MMKQPGAPELRQLRARCETCGGERHREQIHAPDGTGVETVWCEKLCPRETYTVFSTRIDWSSNPMIPAAMMPAYVGMPDKVARKLYRDVTTTKVNGVECYAKIDLLRKLEAAKLPASTPAGDGWREEIAGATE